MSKLYDLGEKYTAINRFIEEAWENEDLTEDDLQMYIETLDSIQDEIENKVGNIAKFLKNIEGDIKAFKEEEERLAKKRKYLQNKFDGLKSYTQAVLEVNKIEKVNTGTFTVKLHKNNPSVGIVDETKIPNTYKIPQPEKIDSKAILAALKQGQKIDGVKLVTDKMHLRIN